MRLRGDPEAAKLVACLVASLAVHAGAVAWLPEPHRHEEASMASVLSVVLQAPAAQSPAPALAAAAPAPPVVPAPAPKPVPRAAAPRPTAPAPAAPKAPSREPALQQAPLVATDLPSPEPGPASSAVSQPAGGRAEPAVAAGSRASAPVDSPVVPPAYGAAYLRNPAPRYPADARREGAEGTVLLRVWVAADGGATRVELDRSSGHRALDAAALGAVRNWRFVPAQRGGEPVAGVVTVPLVFRLETGG